MTTRIKAPALKTREEFLSAVNHSAALQTQRRQLAARRDEKIQNIQDDFAGRLEELDAEIATNATLAEKYAETHRDELFPTKVKSDRCGLATFGFRLGQPTLVLLNRRWSWDSVIEAVKATFAGRYVRSKDTLDKDSLKAELDAAQLAGIGCRIQQNDTFYIEPAVEGGEAIKVEGGE